MKADLRAKIVTVEESLDARRACVKRLKRELPTKIEKRQQLSAKH